MSNADLSLSQFVAAEKPFTTAIQECGYPNDIVKEYIKLFYLIPRHTYAQQGHIREKALMTYVNEVTCKFHDMLARKKTVFVLGNINTAHLGAIRQQLDAYVPHIYSMHGD